MPVVVAVAAGLVAGVAVWLAVGSRTAPLRPTSGWRSAVTGIAAVLLIPPLLGMTFISAVGGRWMQCDGSVPLWTIPDDYTGGGCVVLRPAWEALYPWHWGEWREVCLGMCLDMEVYPGR